MRTARRSSQLTVGAPIQFQLVVLDKTGEDAMKDAEHAMPLSSEASPSDLHEWGNRERNILVLNYTMQCPLQCDFCCYGCHPKRKEKMPFEDARKLVTDAGLFEDFTSVAFTGGEPLLFLDEVIELSSIAQSSGKAVTVATAAHWATDVDQTSTYIQRLVNVGLNRLNVSYDASHAAFVPIENITRVIDSVKAHQVPTYIVSTHYSDSDMMPDFNEPERGIFHVKKVVAKVGRATKACVDYGVTPTISDFSCYRREYHDLVVFYDGAVYPCCSTFNRASPGLVMGNAFTDGFAEVRRRVLGSTMLRTMKRSSFGKLVERLSDYDPVAADQIRNMQLSGGACSLCNKMFSDTSLYSRIYTAFTAFENDFVESLVADLRRRGLSEVELSVN